MREAATRATNEKAAPEPSKWAGALHPIAARDVIETGKLICRGKAFSLGLSLKDSADDCAADRVCEFFLTAPPLHPPGGAGSPINPLALE